jgi:hypothetical protein
VKHSGPEAMIMQSKSIDNYMKYKDNVDCFAVGVMTWELATGINAFD